MINNENLVKVTNRGNWTVCYSIPELQVNRSFAAYESKMIPAEELRRLAWIPGGRSIISNYLIIGSETLAREVLDNVEPEYFYSKEDIISLLTTQSDEALMDALDFAPEGVVSMIKEIAVEIKLNDVRKRDIILKATGFDVNVAIRIAEESEAEIAAPKERRVNSAEVSESTESSGRRVPTSRYKTVAQKTE